MDLIEICFCKQIYRWFAHKKYGETKTIKGMNDSL